MSDDAENSTEAQRGTPDEPEVGATSTTVTPDCDAGRLVTAFVWVMQYGVHLTVAGSLLLIGLVLVFDVRILRSLQIVSLAAGLSAVIAGRWVGGQAVDPMDDPQTTWLVDIDLLNRDDAGVYTCLASQRSEWTVVDGQLRWATPNLASSRGVDLDTREVAGAWVDSLPDPMLARALEYLRCNRKQLEPKARKGESLEINSFAIVRATVVKTVKHVVWTFEKGALPDDGDALHAEVNSVLEGFNLDSSDSTFDEDPTEWAPGDSDPALDPLADLDRRRKQHATDGESE